MSDNRLVLDWATREFGGIEFVLFGTNLRTNSGNLNPNAVITGINLTSDSGPKYRFSDLEASVRAFVQLSSNSAFLRGDDEITGSRLGDLMDGLAGDDLIRGGRGADILQGDRGRDELAGDAGRDLLFGGSGNDELFGGSGRDPLNGQAGNDQLQGDGGSDRLFGGSGADTLDGGRGNDVLVGNGQKDVFIGGGGADRFVFTSKSGRDVVEDFGRGSDRLDFSDVDPIRNFNDLTNNHIRQADDDVLISFQGGVFGWRTSI